MSKLCDDIITMPNYGCPTDTCKCSGCPEEFDCDLCPEYGCHYLPQKWSYNFTEDGLWDNEVFETGKEAYDAGKEEALDRGDDVFYIGQLAPITISRNVVIDTDDILDAISQQLDDEYGSDFEHGERWYEDITSDAKLELEEMINTAFQEWLQKTDNHPKTLTVIDIDEYNRATDTYEKVLSNQQARDLANTLTMEMLKPEEGTK